MLIGTPYLVRLGMLGHVGRFAAVDAVRYPRGTQVICRTSRGLEVGEVLQPATSVVSASLLDGELIRGLTVQDEMLVERIERRKREAVEACNDLLTERGLPAILVDAELLFDGQSLYFYFLGEVDVEVEAMTEELMGAYEAQVQFRSFTESVTHGCGPDCGTEQAAGGCDSGSCSSCALSDGCGVRPPAPRDV